MTDPAGRSFLSYRRTRRDEAALIIAAQHEHGIPTWQDISDLDEGSTEAQVDAVLSDPRTANAVIWLTPDVAESDFIRKVEVPSIVRRVGQADAFFAIPVAAGGLDYASAGKVATQGLSIHNFATWNMERVSRDPIEPADAVELARRVLARRLKRIAASSQPSDKVDLPVYSRTAPPAGLHAALVVDWSHIFRQARSVGPAPWSKRLAPALRVVADEALKHLDTRQIIASGRPTVTTALALGRAFLAVSGARLAWRQQTNGLPDQLWQLDMERVASPFTTELVAGSVAADALAVCVSITADAELALARMTTGPEFRSILRITPEDGFPHRFQQPGQALDVAHKVIGAIRDTCCSVLGIGRIHLFFAGPVGLAMLIGQLSNTLGPLSVYEHIETDAIGEYRLEAEIAPTATSAAA